MLKIVMLSIYLLVGAVMDIRRRSVPLLWILLGAVMTLLFILSSVIAGSGVRETMRDCMLGAAVSLPFLAAAWLRPRHFGRADGAAILMIGLVTGAVCTAWTVFFALVFAAIGGAAQLIRRRAENWKEQALAFLPCLAAGFIGAQFI